MSARAAWRLESLGFREVYRYTGGKVEWAAYGLPVEGKNTRVPRAVDVARGSVPTCCLGDRMGPVRDRIRAAGWDLCIVANDERVVLGILEGDAWKANGEERVQEVMKEGPSTFRPDVPLDQLFQYLQKNRYRRIVVTNPDGQLMGILYQDDAQKRWDQHQRSRSARSSQSRSQ